MHSSISFLHDTSLILCGTYLITSNEETTTDKFFKSVKMFCKTMKKLKSGRAMNLYTRDDRAKESRFTLQAKIMSNSIYTYRI